MEGGVTLCKCMKDVPGQGLAGTVDIRGRALCLVSVEIVQREVQKEKNTPGTLNTSLRMGWVTLWSQSYLSNDCRERETFRLKKAMVLNLEYLTTFSGGRNQMK